MIELPIFEARVVGSRHATHVRVMDGAYAGRRGVVVKVHHLGSILVRLDPPGGQIRTTELPFAQSELRLDQGGLKR